MDLMKDGLIRKVIVLFTYWANLVNFLINVHVKTVMESTDFIVNNMQNILRNIITKERENEKAITGFAVGFLVL